MKVARLMVLITSLCVSGGLGAEISKSIFRAVGKLIDEAEITERTPGLAILVNDTKHQEILFQRYVGQANLTAGTPIGRNTPFRLGSVSKPMTATAILQLVENGKLAFEEPAQRYLPATPWNEVTIHHLLTHTAGPPEYTGFQFLKSRATNADILSYMEGKRLQFPPGSQRKYSNTGYAMLASVIEAVSGQSYAGYMKHSVFEPAGMSTAVVPGLQWENVPNRAVGYNRVLRQYIEDDADFLNGIVGDGGVYASTEDLDRWMTAFFENRLVSREMVDLALRRNPVSGEKFGYGYGWIIDRLAGEKIAWHNGNWVGFNTFVGRLVSQEINIVVLSNAGLDARGLEVTKLGFSIACCLMTAPQR